MSGGGVALLSVDLQRDFLHPDGAYARGGLASPELAALPERVAPVVAAGRRLGVPFVSAQFTIVTVPGRDPLIAPHLLEHRPFLREGDFAPGSWGNALMEPLGPADVVVEKVAYSAFHQTRLEWVLRGLDVRRLVVCGIVTNGGVASTVRDAHLRGIEVTLLTDGCAAFDPAVHDATLVSLGGVTEQIACAEAPDALHRLVVR